MAVLFKKYLSDPYNTGSNSVDKVGKLAAGTFQKQQRIHLTLETHQLCLIKLGDGRWCVLSKILNSGSITTLSSTNSVDKIGGNEHFRNS
ncbi:hypothetical protein AVEN_212795-1 [Araneus ventricosus]|uniref:Uncharacterized protein n=1 Tax=Araneus ventricosus TaxID=182803 RepID=A0A4Y2L1Q3_ARAVE|nr:hypothetical protein AVEN_212795-1 [Araneus ventricosus]